MEEFIEYVKSKTSVGTGSAACNGQKIINNSATPIGGPTYCLWLSNNCGPNDEPFGFHSGIVVAVLGDGSVRTFRDGLSWQVTRALVTANGGEVNVNFD